MKILEGIKNMWKIPHPLAKINCILGFIVIPIILVIAVIVAVGRWW